MNQQKLKKLIKEVNSCVGQTVQTQYGPSLVVGIVEDEDGRLLVHLKEFGEEDYHVDIEQWEMLLQ